MLTVRPADSTDADKIYSLYKKVAQSGDGIARTADEITQEYIHGFMTNAAATGIELVIDNPANEKEIIGEIHCYQLTPKVFGHIFSELTIVIDPDFHGQGIGKTIFTHLLEMIKNTRPDILRVELIARESNTKAIAFYEKLGFMIEGKLAKRIRVGTHALEADIPMAWFNPNYSG